MLPGLKAEHQVFPVWVAAISNSDFRLHYRLFYMSELRKKLECLDTVLQISFLSCLQAEMAKSEPV